MANRNWKRDRAALEQGIVDLFANVAIGATGAPTISTSASKGVSSIARNSAGKYTVTLQDKYKSLLGLNIALKLAAGAPATASSAQPILRSEDVGVAKTLVIEFVDSTGAAIELTNGVTILAHVKLKNSSV
jgi:hypothetical protein